MLKRYLAIDYGAKRTGLAVGDSLTRQAGPVDVIHASNNAELLRGLRDAIDTFGPDELVVGIPYNADGTAGDPAKKAEALCLLLEQHTGLVVHRIDETLTSYQADDQMKQSGLTHAQKKARRDALAAAAILRDFLDQL